MNWLGSLAVIAALFAAPGTALAQSDDANEAAARQALDGFGRCVAEIKPRESLRVLAQDFRTTGYTTGLRMLSQDARRECASDTVGRQTEMRSSGLLFAGAVAENLLEQGDLAVNARLARAAAAQIETYGPSDAVAQCLARSLPDQVGALFATIPGDTAEAEAAAPLLAVMDACADAAGLSARVEATVPAIRAMVATAALRLVVGAEEADA